jgi:hypothetical protein
MKISPLLLAGSLAANVLLAAFTVFHSPAASPASGRAASAADKTGPDGSPAASAAAESSSGGTKDALPSPRTWAALQPGDLHALVDRLRAAGFPASLIRAIVGAQVSEQFAAKRRALMPSLEDTPFWKTNTSPFGDSAAIMQYANASRALNQEQNKLMKDLLGADATADTEEAKAAMRQRYGDIAPEKIDQLQTLLAGYSQQQQDISLASKGVYLPEDRAKLAEIEQQKNADLAQLLTPQELEDYNLRNSSTAMSLRSRLASFNPTEDEYKSIFRLQQAFDEQYGSNTYSAFSAPPTPDQMRERQTQQQALDAQIQNVLSPDRAADYKQATDPAYQQINRLVTRLELPPSAAADVVTVQQDIQQRATAVRQDRTLAPADRTAALAALAAEASTKITTTLGTSGFEAYKSYGGTWLQNLQPRPAPPARK